jgi:hypothetical protein
MLFQAVAMVAIRLMLLLLLASMGRHIAFPLVTLLAPQAAFFVWHAVLLA